MDPAGIISTLTWCRHGGISKTNMDHGVPYLCGKPLPVSHVMLFLDVCKHEIMISHLVREILRLLCCHYGDNGALEGSKILYTDWSEGADLYSIRVALQFGTRVNSWTLNVKFHCFIQ